MKKLIPFIITFLFAIILIFINKPNNLGATFDSAYYLEAARNFSEGNGLTDNHGQLVNLWPPGYPLLLGTISRFFGVDVLEVGIFLNSFLLLIFIFPFIFILREFNLSYSIIISSTIILLFSLPCTIFSMFWSESLFLGLLTFSLLFIIKWSKTNKPVYLLLAGIFIGLSFITRYAALGFIAGFSFFLLFFQNKILHKLKNILIFLFPFILTLFIWSLYTHSYKQPAMEREISLHLINTQKIKTGVSVIFGWFIPNIFNIYIRFFILILIIFPIIFLFRLKDFRSHFWEHCQKYKLYIFLFLTLVLSYLAFVIFSISFLDRSIPLDNRILSPIFPIFLILIMIFLNILIANHLSKIIPYIIILLLLINIPLTSFPVWNTHFHEGTGHSSVKFKYSETLNYTLINPPRNVFSNAPDLLSFYKVPVSLNYVPEKFSYMTGKANNLFLKEVFEMKNAVKNNNAHIIIFSKINRGFLMSEGEILKEFHDFRITQFKDGFLIHN